jgi:hypothetical protein
MSIQTIDKRTVGKVGVQKKINEGAMNMVFDILQATQYSTPIPSTVRELGTNAWDSQREKEVAISILTGKTTVEDHYIKRNGAQYEDSNFDPSYYALDHLDTDNNTVELEYEENMGVGFCDVFRVKDFGVGLGDARLEGILSLG